VPCFGRVFLKNLEWKYNIHKGRMVFFSTDLAQNGCQTLNAAVFGEIGGTVSRPSFSPISTQNWKCQSA
jgi:hypothetical protein